MRLCWEVPVQSSRRNDGGGTCAQICPPGRSSLKTPVVPTACVDQPRQDARPFFLVPGRCEHEKQGKKDVEPRQMHPCVGFHVEQVWYRIMSLGTAGVIQCLGGAVFVRASPRACCLVAGEESAPFTQVGLGDAR